MGEGDTPERTTAQPITPRLEISSHECENGKPEGSPFCFFAGVVSEAPRVTRGVSGRRAPRERCDQLVLRSKPGGVMLPSGTRGAHAPDLLLSFAKRKRTI
jgi:hypothetical protein